MATLETMSKRNGEDRIELTVTIPADEVQRYIDAAYKEAGRVRIPGFRQGRAPRRVLENHFGGKGYFQAQATDEVVKQSLPLAIDAEGHVPLDKPEIAELDLVVEGDDYHYTTSFTVAPLLELSSYEPVQIELPSEEPTDEEIEQRIGIMLDYYVDFEDVTDRPVQDGDALTLEMEVTDDGQRVEGLSGASVPYQMGSGGMPVSFDEHLLGMVIGETRAFDFDIASAAPAAPDAATPPDAGTDAATDAGKLAHATVTVKEISAKVRPELTDAWVKEHIEFDSVDEFRSRIVDTLRTQKQSEIASLKDQRISEELASRLQGEVPSLLVTQTEQSIYRDFFTSLQRNNQTFDGFLASMNTTPEAFREDIRKQATATTAQTLALDALARHLGLEVTDEEVREEFASSGGKDHEELYRQWQSNGRISEVREGLLRMKAARHLKENAEIFEPSTKPVAEKVVKKAAEKKASAKKASAKRKSAATAPEAEAAPATALTTAPDAEATPEVATAPEADTAPATPLDTAPSASKSTEKEPGDEEVATKRKSAPKKTDNKG